MFWGCFTYNHKGPCHIYYKETAEQKAHYEEQMARLNKDEIEAEGQEVFRQQNEDIEEKWRLLRRKKPGKPRSWEAFWKKYQQKRNGKYKGGIDNIHYTYECLIPKVIPFYKEIMLQRHNPDEFECDMLGYSFMQDGAPSHASKWTTRILKKEGIPIHKHVGNSPDMNAIEKAWMPMRIGITKDWNRPHTIEWSDRAWRTEWDNLHQDQIRAWVARMAAINTLIIEHEGGNEFHG